MAVGAEACHQDHCTYEDETQSLKRNTDEVLHQGMFIGIHRIS